MTPRQPDWDIDVVRGEEAEELVRKMRHHILVGTCEVKRDDRAAETGNVYVEYACKTATGWQPSGIATTKALNYAFVIGRTVVYLPTWMLKRIARESGSKRECLSGSHPTKGVVIPVTELVAKSLVIARDELNLEKAA